MSCSIDLVLVRIFKGLKKRDMQNLEEWITAYCPSNIRVPYNSRKIIKITNIIYNPRKC